MLDQSSMCPDVPHVFRLNHLQALEWDRVDLKEKVIYLGVDAH
ncbi:hypothetical protein OAJ78_06455 [Gammaproteobacteria bacterium]|nr:hypothetical protein [Gammaproteobacteria bacterium]